MVKPATKMMSYQKSDDEETAVLLVPTILPTSTTTTTTTMDGRSTKWISRVASVAGMMMLVVAGCTVWMGDGGITTTAEGLVVATQGGVPCVPASLDATFSGVSATGNSHYFPFQTCYQNGDKREYCWTNAYYRIVGPNLGGKEYMPCRPVGDDPTMYSTNKTVNSGDRSKGVPHNNNGNSVILIITVPFLRPFRSFSLQAAVLNRIRPSSSSSSSSSSLKCHGYHHRVMRQLEAFSLSSSESITSTSVVVATIASTKAYSSSSMG